jgi:hypothetical protein
MSSTYEWAAFGAIWLVYMLILLCVAGFHIWATVEMSQIAKKKGYSAGKYGCLCFFGSIFGYLVVLALPDKVKESREQIMLQQLLEVNSKLSARNKAE